MTTVSLTRPNPSATAKRKTAVTAGVLFLLTEVGAIAGLALYDPILNGIDYINGSGADNQILFGALFEVLLVISAVGTAVTLYPILKRHNEGVAMAFVMARLLETVAIMIGILSMLTVVTLRRQYDGSADADSEALSSVGSALVAVHDWTFLLGPNFALGVASLLLAYLMYSSSLIPRPIAVLGLVGGVLILGSAVAVMFGAYEQTSTPGLIVALPVFAWELALAGWLIAKGFRPVSILSAPAGV